MKINKKSFDILISNILGPQSSNFVHSMDEDRFLQEFRRFKSFLKILLNLATMHYFSIINPLYSERGWSGGHYTNRLAVGVDKSKIE